MLEVISLIISCIIQTVSCTYAMKYLTQKKVDLKNITNILILLMMTILFYMLMTNDFGVSKPFIIYIIVIIGFKYFYKISFNESIIMNFISMILTIISEAIISILIIVFKYLVK